MQRKVKPAVEQEISRGGTSWRLIRNLTQCAWPRLYPVPRSGTASRKKISESNLKSLPRAILLAAVALSGAAMAQGAARPCGYTDLMPVYREFALRTASLSPEGRAAAFIKEIAARYPDYYAPEIYGDPAKLQERAVRFFDPVKRAAFFQGVAPVTDEQVREMGSIIGREFLQQQRRFMRTFTDFQCRTTVEFAVSLLKFDGHPADFGGKQHLLFGVEMIAAFHGAEDMPAFFDHEIFHIYHKQLLTTQLHEDEAPAWVTMWVEGLATYVSQRMNPQLDAQQVLWFPRDLVARMNSETSRAARLLLRDIDKTDAEGDRWFLASTRVEGLPERAGYYLGYLFAQSVGEHAKLPALARMPLEEVHEKERAFLAELARK